MIATPLKVGDRVWYFTPYKGTEAKRVIKKDPLTGKGHYVIERRPAQGGYWNPGGEVLDVLGSHYKVQVDGEWDPARLRWRKEERIMPAAELKLHPSVAPRTGS